MNSNKNNCEKLRYRPTKNIYSVELKKKEAKRNKNLTSVFWPFTKQFHSFVMSMSTFLYGTKEDTKKSVCKKEYKNIYTNEM